MNCDSCARLKSQAIAFLVAPKATRSLFCGEIANYRVGEFGRAIAHISSKPFYRSAIAPHLESEPFSLESDS